uniref:HEPN domain-containing protein n=1 Tax=candidate division WOR-3 bacterium TaxID=2052148 RepID=A0A7V0Z6B6_UNCW3
MNRLSLRGFDMANTKVDIEVKNNEVIDKFVTELRNRLGDKILGIYLFGSVAKETATKESDIDILVVYTNEDERRILEVTSEIAFVINCEEDKIIEVVTMSKEEYENSLGRSPFLWEILKFGRPLYSILTGTEWNLDFAEYLSLAEEYLGYAKDGLSEQKIRLAIDVGYNTCELLVKSLIVSKKEPLASSHGGIVGQFGRLFILSGELPEHLGRNLHLALELRAKARYRPKATLKIEDAQFVINLAEELLSLAKKRLK